MSTEEARTTEEVSTDINSSEKQLENVEEIESKEKELSNESIIRNKENNTTSNSGNVFRSAQPVTNREATNNISGNIVNQQVNIKDFNFESNKIYPNNSGYTNMNAKFNIDGEVTQGDYFTFKAPHNLTFDGDIDYSNVNNIFNLPDLLNQDGNIVATGIYNTESKLGKYTFTDFVNNKKNINGQFSLPVFTDRKNTPNSGNYAVDFNIADKVFNSNITIDYGDPAQGQPESYGANITSFITEIDLKSGKNEYKQTIYVNPKGNKLNNSKVTIQGFHDDRSKSSTLVDKNNTNLRIYEVVDKSKLTQSYYVDTNDSNYKDVTNDVLPYVYDNGNNTMTIDFGNINKTYIVLVDGHYDNNGENVKTRVIETNTDIYGSRRSSYYWDNENILRTGSGNADGEEGDADADSDADSDSDADA
ncbi:fibrinogen-binding adhesin SdrG C-terminal domain-containing protein, partial [Mammaliicoccus vitulinus]|uniref:fibrinogen-binding adhesin SdrG C-terminal domain-containing protein n=1 Tax=Mammaliicoccus vitulinus TaxID=71237 RepID=UPI00035E3409